MPIEQPKTQVLKSVAEDGSFSHGGNEYEIKGGEVEVPVDVAHHMLTHHKENFSLPKPKTQPPARTGGILGKKTDKDAE